MKNGVDEESCIKYSRDMGLIGDVIEDVHIDSTVPISVVIFGDIPGFLIGCRIVSLAVVGDG